ncbi:MAG: M56 family metallopeptidase [Sphingomonadaceae bacterium]|nr:M56 family metallopeptidase [Sphingomonadaceae bacterium]
MSAAPLAALELALRATSLIGAAWAAAWMLRKAGASAAARHLAWLLGIAALLALPTIRWLAPPLELPILHPEAAPAATAAFGLPAGAAAPGPEAAFAWSDALLACYLAGVAALLLRFLRGRHLLSLLWRQAEPAAAAGWPELLGRMRRELGVYRPVALRIARGPAMPMTWGTLMPRILLPAEADAWSAERRRLVLLHELAHVARRDSLARSAAALACALYWFHPGVWLATRQLRLEQEHAADDRVLKAGAAARSYARGLLELARRADGAAWPRQAAAMAGMCQLERRVLAITGAAHREPPGPAFLAGAGGIAAATLLAAAAAVPVSRMPALPEPIGGEAAFPAAPPGPAPTAPAATRAARLAERSAAPAPAERRARDAGDGFTAHAPAQGGERAAATEAQTIQPEARSGMPAPIASVAPPSAPIAPAEPLRVYGPPAPQPVAEERESDPRIPAALRRGDAGRGAGPAAESDQGARPGASRSHAGTRIWPRLILSPGQAFP